MVRTIISETAEKAAAEAAEKAAEKATIENAIFCIDNGIPKEKVIEKIASDLECSLESAEEFFQQEISDKLSK